MGMGFAWRLAVAAAVRTKRRASGWGEIGCEAAHSFMTLMEYQYGGISPGMPVWGPHAHYQARMD